MGYEHDWTLIVGHRVADLDVAPPASWQRVEHIVVDHLEDVVGAVLFASQAGNLPDDAATGPFSPALIDKTLRRVAREGRKAGIRAAPRLWSVHSQV